MSNVALTKICKNCGLEKPLSAFLILTGSEGTTYGNICSRCRKALPENRGLEHEGTTTSTTGIKIDSKSKVQGEIEKRELRKQVDDTYFGERDKRDQIRIERSAKILSTEHKERQHRSFLEDRKRVKPSSRDQEKKAIFGSEEQKAEASRIDFRGPVEDTRIAGKVKHASSVFQAFKTWLGKAAPIVNAAERASKGSKKETDKPELAPLNEFNKTRKH